MSISPVFAQRESVNYDEAQVPDYELPPLLRLSNGQAVTNPEQWQTRRAELLSIFAEQIYGRTPELADSLRFEIMSDEPNALNGTAIRREMVVYFTEDQSEPSMTLLLYLPAKADGPVPLFLGLNFYGNHTIHSDPSITLSNQWMRANEEYGIVNHRATEASRGVRAYRWPVGANTGPRLRPSDYLLRGFGPR